MPKLDVPRSATALYEAREAKGFTQTKAAALIGVPRDTYAKWERRGTPREYLWRTAKVLDTTAERLARGEDSIPPPPKPASAPSEPEIVEAAGDKYAAIPRFDIQAGAGPGRALPGSPAVLHKILFRFHWLRSVTRAPLEMLAAIEVDGDSMEPTLRKGDMVLVDLTQRSPAKMDSIYVLNNDGDLQVKRVQAHPTTRRLYIRSDNPAYESWPDIDPADIDIVGRVFWMGRRV